MALTASPTAPAGTIFDLTFRRFNVITCRYESESTTTTDHAEVEKITREYDVQGWRLDKIIMV